MSLADKIFINMCNDVLINGTSTENEKVRPKWEDGSYAYTIKKFGVINTYNLAEEFPIITLRRTGFKSCIDELLWIYQKKSNNIKDLNSNIWNQWADSNGSIGTCYGYEIGKKSLYKEGYFDQMDRVLYDLKENPFNRRIITNTFVHDDLYTAGLAPCAYSMTYNVTINKNTGKYVLNAILNQRSSDILTANNWNVVQYAVLVHMLASINNMEAGTLIHVIADAHIYDRHISLIEDLIKREPLNAPKFWINPEIKNFYDFTLNDFALIDYNTHEQIKNIPIAI